MYIAVDASLEPLLQVMWGEIRAAQISSSRPFSLQEHIVAELRDLLEGYRGVSLDELGPIASMRSVFRQLGLDPSLRTSPEALLGEVLSGNGLRPINNAVDAARLCLLRSLHPAALYDRDKLEGNIQLRLGRPAERMEAIGLGPKSVEGWPLLADEQGPFGSPICDAERAAVTESSRSLLFVLFAPSATGEDGLLRLREQALEEIAAAVGAEDPAL